MNNAIINFLFNTEGANREIDNFKSRFDKTIKAISDSSIGKFAAIGGGLASIFSIKQFITDTKELSRAFNDMNGNVPIEKIGRFVNLMGSLGVEQSEALNTLQDLEKKLLKPWENIEFTAAVSQLGLNIADYKKGNEVLVNEFYDDLRDKFAENPNLEQQIYLNKMGISTAPMDRYLRGLPLGMDIKTFREEIEKMPTITNDSYAAMMNMGFAMQNLRAQARGLGETLVKQGIDKLILNIANALKKFNDLNPETKDKILKTVGGFILIVSSVKLVSSTLGLLVNSFRLVFAPVRILMGLFNPLLLTLGLMAGLIWAAQNNFLGFGDALDWAAECMDDFFNSLKDRMPWLAAFVEELSLMLKAMGHPVDTITEALENIKNILNGNDLQVTDIEKSVKQRWQSRREERKRQKQTSGEDAFSGFLQQFLNFDVNKIGKMQKAAFSTMDKYERNRNNNNTTVINYTDNSTKNINTNNPRAVDEALYKSGANYLVQQLALQQ